MSEEGEREMIGTKQVAEVMGTTERHVRRLARDHGLPAYRIGGLLRFYRGEVLEWIEDQRQGGAA